MADTKEETKEEIKEEKSENGVSDDTKDQILRQIEYYFGDINLPRDKFLGEQVKLDDGWVPIDVLLTFNRLKNICADATVIGNVIFDANSDLLEIDEGLKKIRRKPELIIPEFNDERRLELQKRTAYVKGFPNTSTLEELQKFFESYGKNEAIQMRHYNDKATKKTVFKGSVFVIFKTVDDCKNFLELEEVKYNDADLIRKWQSVYIEEKKIEREERNAKRKKGKKEVKKDDTKPETEIKFPRGAILHLTGFTNENTPRETIKQKITEINKAEPAYITFNKGEKEAYIRFAEENEAIEFMKKIDEKKLEIDGNDLELEVLEGEKETNFLVELSVEINKRRQQNKGNKGHRGRKRKGFGRDDGPRHKHQRN